MKYFLILIHFVFATAYAYSVGGSLKIGWVQTAIFVYALCVFIRRYESQMDTCHCLVDWLPCHNTPHVLYTCFHSYYGTNSSSGELYCSLSVGRNRKSSCENVCSFISREIGGRYKRLQLVEKHSLEILFVLGTDTKHQCK